MPIIKTQIKAPAMPITVEDCRPSLALLKLLRNFDVVFAGTVKFATISSATRITVVMLTTVVTLKHTLPATVVAGGKMVVVEVVSASKIEKKSMLDYTKLKEII